MSFRLSLALLLLVALSPQSVAQDQSLFDGKTLKGWKVTNPKAAPLRDITITEL